MNAAEMLQNRSAGEAEQERWPLQEGIEDEWIEKGWRTDMCEARVDKEVQKAAEEFVANEDGNLKVTKNESTGVFARVGP